MFSMIITFYPPVTDNGVAQEVAERWTCTGLGGHEDISRVIAAHKKENEAFFKAVEVHRGSEDPRDLMRDKDCVQVRSEVHLQYISITLYDTLPIVVAQHSMPLSSSRPAFNRQLLMEGPEPCKAPIAAYSNMCWCLVLACKQGTERTGPHACESTAAACMTGNAGLVGLYVALPATCPGARVVTQPLPTLLLLLCYPGSL
jgi:hypothetical protein